MVTTSGQDLFQSTKLMKWEKNQDEIDETRLDVG